MHSAEALHAYKRIHHPQVESLADLNMGRALLQKGQYAEATRYIQAALMLSGETSYRNGEAFAGAWQAMAHRFLGLSDQALTYGNAALTVARDAELRDGECEALIALGWTYRSLRNQPTAQARFDEVVDIARQDNLTVYEALGHDGLAHLALASGNADLARTSWVRALSLYSADAADAVAVRRHLSALDRSPTTCWRCSVDTEEPNTGGGAGPVK